MLVILWLFKNILLIFILIFVGRNLKLFLRYILLFTKHNENLKIFRFILSYLYHEA